MNVIKYRQVGTPNAPIVRVRVVQSKRAVYSRAEGKVNRATVKLADRVMSRKGFVRAGVRHGQH